MSTFLVFGYFVADNEEDAAESLDTILHMDGWNMMEGNTYVNGVGTKLPFSEAIEKYALRGTPYQFVKFSNDRTNKGKWFIAIKTTYLDAELRQKPATTCFRVDDSRPSAEEFSALRAYLLNLGEFPGHIDANIGDFLVSYVD